MAGEVLGIDVGGSSVKAGLVDLKAGRLAGELIAAPTPRPSTPVAVTNVLAGLAGRLPASTGRVGVAFPSVVKEGTAYTAANIDAAWVGTDGASLASQALGRPVLFLNDADAAGLAEMRWGAGRGCKGTVVMLTFGTGIGKLPQVGTTIFTVMSRRARELDALNLGQGFPDYDIDPRLTELVAEAMRGGHNQYAPMEGVLALRERIAAKLLRAYRRAIDPESEITVTLGATEAIFSAIQAAVGAGDEVIAFDPAYDSYEPAVRLSGARCLRLPLVQPGFRYDWERVRAALNARTRLILFNSPHNPACTTAQSADLEALAELIDGRDVAVLSDEVYEHVVFDGGQHHSVLTHPALAPRRFAVFAFGMSLP